jgi:hypothetical protein
LIRSPRCVRNSGRIHARRGVGVQLLLHPSHEYHTTYILDQVMMA